MFILFKYNCCHSLVSIALHIVVVQKATPGKPLPVQGSSNSKFEKSVYVVIHVMTNRAATHTSLTVLHIGTAFFPGKNRGTSSCQVCLTMSS